MYIQANSNGVKITSADKSWKLILNGTTIIDLRETAAVLEAGGSTEIFVASTKAECETEVSRLNLQLPTHLKK